jgi:D-alanyl-D-alanine carboxypeptidase
VKSSATVRAPLIAPLPGNVAVGELQVRDGSDVVARVPLFPAKTVAEGGWWTRTTDSVSLWFD